MSNDFGTFCRFGEAPLLAAPMVAVIAQVARGNRAIRLCRQAIEQGQRGAMVNLAALLLDESAGECGTVAVSAARRKQCANQ